jgi:P27 family predicted phage terminase small subunit
VGLATRQIGIFERMIGKIPPFGAIRMGARGPKSAAEMGPGPPPVRLVESVPVELPMAPEHLSAEAQHWWRQVVADFDLDHHHLMLLQCACEAWDRMVEAREIIAEEGITVQGVHGPKTHPAVGVERDARTAFARLIRELDLDEPQPSPGPYMRPPALRSNRRR